jgi:hypothetical protein
MISGTTLLMKASDSSIRPLRRGLRREAVDEARLGAVADVVDRHQLDRVAVGQVVGDGEQREALAGGAARQLVTREPPLAGLHAMPLGGVADAVDHHLGAALGDVVLVRQHRERRRRQAHRQGHLGDGRLRPAEPGSRSLGDHAHGGVAGAQVGHRLAADLDGDRVLGGARAPEGPARPRRVLLLGDHLDAVALHQLDPHVVQPAAATGQPHLDRRPRADAPRRRLDRDLRLAAGPEPGQQDQHQHDEADHPETDPDAPPHLPLAAAVVTIVGHSPSSSWVWIGSEAWLGRKAVSICRRRRRCVPRCHSRRAALPVQKALPSLPPAVPGPRRRRPPGVLEEGAPQRHPSDLVRPSALLAQAHQPRSPS